MWVAHALGIPGTFSLPPRISDPDMHDGMCVTHVPWCMTGSLTSGFLWSRWRCTVAVHEQTRNFTYLARGPWHRLCSPQFPVSATKKLWGIRTVVDIRFTSLEANFKNIKSISESTVFSKYQWYHYQRIKSKSKTKWCFDNKALQSICIYMIIVYANKLTNSCLNQIIKYRLLYTIWYNLTKWIFIMHLITHGKKNGKYANLSR